VLGVEDILGEVEMRQLTHAGKQSDVTALHSEHRTVTNATTQAGCADQCPGMRVGCWSTIFVIPYHFTLLIQHTELSAVTKQAHC